MLGFDKKMTEIRTPAMRARKLGNELRLMLPKRAFVRVVVVKACVCSTGDCRTLLTEEQIKYNTHALARIIVCGVVERCFLLLCSAF